MGEERSFGSQALSVLSLNSTVPGTCVVPRWVFALVCEVGFKWPVELLFDLIRLSGSWELNLWKIRQTKSTQTPTNTSMCLYSREGTAWGGCLCSVSRSLWSRISSWALGFWLFGPSLGACPSPFELEHLFLRLLICRSGVRCRYLTLGDTVNFSCCVWDCGFTFACSRLPGAWCIIRTWGRAPPRTSDTPRKVKINRSTMIGQRFRFE